MLRFNKITIQNFGPYYGTQEIHLMPQHGVSFIWGLNGFGKTSFLNAVRYALWGSLANSKHANRPIVKFINHKAITNGENMMVRLDCDYNGKRCVIIRLLERKSSTDGTHNEDYDYSLSVSLNAQTLSQEDALKFLSKTLPLNISRFYLFDAELLDQYEKLVEENNDNAELKLEIENILGLPILDGARQSITGNGGISSQLEKEYDRVTKEDQQNAKKIKTYELNKQRKEQLEQEIKDLKEKIEKLYTSKQELEDILKENSQFRALVEQEKSIQQTINNLNVTLEEESQKISKTMEYLWTVFFDSSIEAITKEKQSDLENLKNQETENKEESLLIELIALLERRNASHCPICSTEIVPNTLDSLKNKLKETSVNHNLRDSINRLQDEIISLTNMKEKHIVDEIIAVIESYLNIINKLRSEEFELETIKVKKSSYHTTVTEAEILKVAKNYSTVNQQISLGKQGLEEAELELVATKNKIEKLRTEISKNGGKAVKRVENHRHFVETLESILNDGVAWFREDLKKRVEESASQIFRSISHNKDYVGLKINDNYGLEIIKSDGNVAPNRSEGFEQVVAISLIAALHKNAPIAGPIIMDSTFQRIDALHKEATLKELPNMAQQIIVLAYPTEVDKDKAVNLLGSYYLQDFELEQIDSLETIIHSLNHE